MKRIVEPKGRYAAPSRGGGIDQTKHVGWRKRSERREKLLPLIQFDDKQARTPIAWQIGSTETQVYVVCPYCWQTHTHGVGDGTRERHCIERELTRDDRARTRRYSGAYLIRFDFTLDRSLMVGLGSEVVVKGIKYRHFMQNGIVTKEAIGVA